MEVDQRDAVALTGFAFEPIAAALPLASQVHQRSQTQPSKHADVVRGGLGRAPSPVAQPMHVEVRQTKNAMIDEDHVEIVGSPCQHLMTNERRSAGRRA